MLTFGGKIWIKSVMEETWHKKNLKAKKKGDGRETLSLQDLAKAPHEDYKKEDREKGIRRGLSRSPGPFAFARPDDGGEDIFILGGR